MPAISVKSPGKTILFGEHAVVYGHPAIAVPIKTINLEVKLIARPDYPQGKITIQNHNSGSLEELADLEENNPIKASIRILKKAFNLDHMPAAELHISSQIPIASGLGSSAALAVAIVRGFSQYLGFNLSNQRINELAYEVEIIQHGTPSGIDNSVITYNQPVFYIKDQPIEFLKFKNPFHLILANSGIHSLTKEVVAEVRESLNQDPDRINPLLESMGEIARSAKLELTKGNLQSTGRLMTENHKLLNELGVSCSELDELVNTALDEGALGAKLCGSGKGGNMVALVEASQSSRIKQSLLAKGAVSALSTIVG